MSVVDPNPVIKLILDGVAKKVLQSNVVLYRSLSVACFSYKLFVNCARMCSWSVYCAKQHRVLETVHYKVCVSSLNVFVCVLSTCAV